MALKKKGTPEQIRIVKEDDLSKPVRDVKKSKEMKGK
jgi:hypothetical protein